jgi:hypothetical protein
MTIIIRIGRTALEVFWGVVALLGVILVSSGLFYALGSIDFGQINLANAIALSHLSGGIVVSIIGLAVVAAGYLGIRGRLIITTSEDSK